ncbi:hypothetical protein Nepgr_006966 [Nepenthes gracilis]|uniref:DUF2428 domain-containing protein n=1 Tax=Nepenthes gracilis TaxID=150966 RepID=A0AAD3S688_NEPGR|nr:hypothetical protein Nepgr_006966 [Nepenthes gracilis]
MSAKWRALQHRHRYTYSAVDFPQPYIDLLNRLPCDELSQKFRTQLKELATLNSVYSQVNHLKNVASSFSDLLANGDENVVSIAARFYLEILFLENSLPLHRTLASALAKNRNYYGIIGECFRSLCKEYSGMYATGKRFCVSRVALSMISTPKLGYLVEVVEECCVLVALDIIYGLSSVVSETNGWARPSPIVMEHCQEALSCLYYLLQRFPAKFADKGGYQSGLVPQDLNLLEMVLTVILSILKSSSFSRDCFVAAGVSFCAALHACLSPEELGYFIIGGIFHQISGNLLDSCKNDLRTVISKVPYKGDLCFELQNFSALSRLCLLRGILTAVPRTVLNTQFVMCRDHSNVVHVDGSQNSLQTILYDGILPELCHYCENPTDTHFNFHALTVMQICLQQIKASIFADLVGKTADFDPMPEHMGTRVIRIIWNNLEDPLSQTVKQVHLIFDLLLDVQSTLHRDSDSERIHSFLHKTALDLLCLGPRCKGRYIPLASLTKRLGAKTLLGMSTNLLLATIHAYHDDDVCCAATSFLKCFLEHLRDECWSTDGIERGYEIYRAHCLPPFLYGLASGFSKLRSNLNTYALPSLFEVDVDSIFPMFAFLSIGVGDGTGLAFPELSQFSITLEVEQKVAVVVSLLKVCRFLALFEGDIDSCHCPSVSGKPSGIENEIALVCIKGIQVKVPVEWLVLALTHVDESLRVDAAESLFLNPKTSSLPSQLELNLMRQAVPLNMRCSSTAFQMKWTSLFKKFFSRVRTALERQMRQGTWHPNAHYNGCEKNVVGSAKDLFHFMKWLSFFLFLSCYPSAPYERKIMAMELILTMINVWPLVPPLQVKPGSVSSKDILYIYNEALTLPDSTLLLVGSIIDSWDRLRENSFRILLNFPTPLPGISSQQVVWELISWAKKLICSTRVRESDAGALTLRLIFRKYVVELGWIVRASTSSVCLTSQSVPSNGEHQICKPDCPIIEFIKSLVDWLHAAVEEGEKNLSEACKNSFVHGILLTLRYTFEELDWNSVTVTSKIPELRHALGKLLELVMRITSLALWVVSADAWYLPEDPDDIINDDSFLLELPSEISVPASTVENEVKDSKFSRDTAPIEQIVMVGCWLAMKEVSLLLGTIIRQIPLPRATCSSRDPEELLALTSDVVLDLKQLEMIGDHFLEVILKMKHNGAIDKTRAGFSALCNRLLCSDDPRLCQLTEAWMEQLMERTVAKGQTVDDLLRRSAGIPAAFSALFLSEPEGTPKKLLPRALRWLIDVAGGSLMDQTESCSMNDKVFESSTALINQENILAPPFENDTSIRYSKNRIEGVIPTVHAFNVLRAAFNDTNLATDTSGFSAEAMIISIRSFSSPHWEVRNSACLAYTALVRRMIGFLNVQKRESARRALTGLEFFHRYPTLHSFLFNELKVATELLGDEKSELNLASVVHPSLCPVLILLSRLKPSPIASEAGDDLDPFLFMPFIQRCSTQSNLQIRVLASRALTGLVSYEKLQGVLLAVASQLPCLANQREAAPQLDNKFNTAEGSCHASYNSIHGTLLQLSALVDTNCRNLADFMTKDCILDGLIKVLIKCSWIGSPKFCPCPILNSSFLQVLDHMLSIARTCQMITYYDVICCLLFKLSSECLAVEASVGPFFYDPTISQLRKQAVTSFFSCVFKKSEQHAEVVLPPSYGHSPATNILKRKPEMNDGFFGVEERLILSMSDSSYEVRLATFKWLLQFIKSTETDDIGDGQSGNSIAAIDLWAKTNLQTTMIKLLSEETNHNCTCYILRILSAWNLSQFQKVGHKRCADAVYIGVMDFESVQNFWTKLVSMYEHERHAKSQEALIGCLGFCVRRFTVPFRSNADEPARCIFLHECLSYFVCLIKQQSASSEPVNLRKAAAESMVASGLLEQADLIAASVVNCNIPSENFCSNFESHQSLNMLAYQILDIWFTCIKLLEDEDASLRQMLALDVQKCFPDRFRSSSPARTVPAQVEKVIELTFEFLSSIFGHWYVYFDYLSRWVLNAATSYVVPGGDDPVRQVFDKEIDNHHEEKLLICQICCSQLEKLPVSRTWTVGASQRGEFLSFLKTWRRRFCQQLVSFAEDNAGKTGGVDWIGGVGNHKDAFLPLYANLLGVYALSNIIFNGEAEKGTCLLSDIIEVGKSIKPFLRNPLIYNLYILVIKLHDDLVLELPEGSHFGDDFNPYFLLGY